MDEDLTICDFVETYEILDIRTIPPFTAGSLAYGLRPDSRIKMKIAGIDAPSLYALAVRAIDELAVIRWLHTDDARTGSNSPQLLSALMRRAPAEENPGFDSPEEFMRAYYGTE